MNTRIRRTGPMIAAFIAVVTTIGLLGGCTVGAPDNPNMVRGSGHVITEQRQVSDLSEVVLTMSGNLTIEQNGTEAFTMEGEDNILPLITTEVSGNRLTIGTRSGASFSTTRSLRFYLSVKSISYICATGSGNIGMAGAQGNQLRTETTGSGNVTLTSVAAKSYTAKTTGSGGITASGSAESQDVTGTGSGDYDGRDLQSKSAKVALSGSGNATVKVSDTLDASVSGSGSVRYIGDPAVTRQDQGSGEITKLR
jgi:3D (Asp-Asp-Asp) domain-containing protein